MSSYYSLLRLLRIDKILEGFRKSKAEFLSRVQLCTTTMTKRKKLLNYNITTRFIIILLSMIDGEVRYNALR